MHDFLASLSSFEQTLIIAGAILLALVCWLYSKLERANSRLALSDGALEQAQEVRKKLEDTLAQTQSELSRLREEHGNLRENHAAASFERDRLRTGSQELTARLNEKTEELTEVKQALSAAQAALETQNEAQKQLRETDERRHRQSYEELQSRLTALGQQMVKSTASDLSTIEQERFSKAVEPLKEELTVFREFLTKSQAIGAEQSGALKAELGKLMESSGLLSKQAQDLTRALTSGGKAQGMWGELQLERVLEAAGLTQGVEFLREVAGNRALDEKGRPDAVIKLPEKHCLIIDAKCSLTAYTSYVNASDKTQREAALKEHLSSLRSHIQGLAKRDYADYQSLNSPSFVFMFVPIDGALSAALENDAELYDTAAFSNIYLVSPSSLIPALRVVSNLWVLSRQNERIRALAYDAKHIYEKFTGVLEALDDALKKELTLKASLENLDKRLRGGKGNLDGQLSRFAARAPAVIAEVDSAQGDRSPVALIEEQQGSQS